MQLSGSNFWSYIGQVVIEEFLVLFIVNDVDKIFVQQKFYSFFLSLFGILWNN